MLDRWFMLLEYLKNVFGDDAVKGYNINTDILPFYLSNDYSFCGISIVNKPYVFVIPKNSINLKSYNVQKKKLEVIFSSHIVLCANKLLFMQRENLINNGLEFVEPEKQLFMPSVGTILDNRQINTNNKIIEKFTPQMQLCALFFLYQEKKEHTVNDIAQITGLNIMAISRGLSALNELGLFSIRKVARTNYYTIKTNKAKFISTIKDYLITPVQRIVYTKESDLADIGVKAGYTALEQMTSIVDDPIKTYAISKTAYKSIEDNCKQSVDDFLLSDKIVKVELWKYEPSIFMNNECVDKLSLYLSFENDSDERTNDALNRLMEEIIND